MKDCSANHPQTFGSASENVGGNLVIYVIPTYDIWREILIGILEGKKLSTVSHNNAVVSCL